MKKIIALSSVMALTLTLSACGGGPSGDDIEAALNRVINQQTSSSLVGMMGLSVKIDSVDHVDCDKSGDNYKCTYDVTSTITSELLQQKTQTKTETTTSVFAKRDEGWVFVH
ncbi:hypothetical protein [Celerinatantimonas sp. YJH-8]|uniref:hypothetical protein n=1 Tax=Celerinatantimonas sp. YJH-8 TaxID=3228714 RepID=UPI0038C91C3B